MKKYFTILVVIMAVWGCDLESTGNENYPEVRGKKFAGKPTGEVPSPGCEGCGQAGYFDFRSGNNEVEFIWPGSDIMDGGTYKQTKYKVTINSVYGDICYMTVSEDGKEITDDEYGTVFRDENYPWE